VHYKLRNTPPWAVPTSGSGPKPKSKHTATQNRRELEQSGIGADREQRSLAPPPVSGLDIETDNLCVTSMGGPPTSKVQIFGR